ncbi:ATPase Na+/K+ transporting family member beta 4 [Rhinolophus ferrumequinum]|uniref:Protein ATP1B4 n=1 Tax=Rhinolophus ferrumequinum TaxID=59479 RepID=A0A7J8ATG0_RHIFE|nr:ATPase Na+/K+ transporting family member beta 4 [Rhinolophus ferrumequinum]
MKLVWTKDLPSWTQDNQDEVNQHYLADEEEEAEEARVMMVPNLEEEEEEEEEKEEEEKEEEEGQGQPTINTWWWKLQIVNEYLWDPEKRMSLARTGQSWSVTLVIYFFFYASLAAVIILRMYTLFLTICPYMLTFTERVKPPGVMIRPFVHSLNFNFNVSKPDTWQHYVINLNVFLQGYNDSLQEEINADCTPGQYFIQDGNEDEDKKACQFKRSFLKNCSGLEDPTFGYSTGQPCILLKMNRVNYTSLLVAMDFTDVVKNQAMPVQCQLKGKGIINDGINNHFVGRVIFTLNIET